MSRSEAMAGKRSRVRCSGNLWETCIIGCSKANPFLSLITFSSPCDITRNFLRKIRLKNVSVQFVAEKSFRIVVWSKMFSAESDRLRLTTARSSWTSFAGNICGKVSFATLALVPSSGCSGSLNFSRSDALGGEMSCSRFPFLSRNMSRV